MSRDQPRSPRVPRRSGPPSPPRSKTSRDGICRSCAGLPLSVNRSQVDGPAIPKSVNSTHRCSTAGGWSAIMLTPGNV
jgi:hypothetical protein